MATPVIEVGAASKITTSTTLRAGPAQLLGLFCSTSDGGGIHVLNAVTSGTGTVINAMVLNSGTFYPMPFSMSVGLTVLVSGTANCAIAWNPSPTEST